MWRNLSAVLAGAIVAILVVAACEALGHWLVPPPAGMDASNLESVKKFMPQLRPAAFLIVLLAWFAGSMGGSLVTARLARTARARRICPWIIGGLLFVSGVSTMIFIPHPLWFVILACLVPFAGSWLGMKLAVPRTHSRTPGIEQ